ncbi:hypothetical protein WOLCODRAFT_138148 [Wolfiporia cocos MD-104 SS10]|uniref:BBC1/AIM3 cysteine proteinase-fold domain-containing protein n=1 Tax=Wolfiporia cocos (strain MD-104) TaxID=742152 RepID=A0A2H3K3J5_WOLCO|nr:hypothetical protein WOLCODRAFT_138148 [Wolfiporia cocos MD-104 SS10]
MLSDLKQKATKAKDYGVHKMVTTKEHMKSQPSNKINWDRKPAPPPPPPARQKSTFAPPPSRNSSVSVRSQASTSEIDTSSSSSPASSAQPAPPRRPTHQETMSLAPPPRRSSSIARTGPRAGEENSTDMDRIDWANLSQEDKEVLFSWLDEFFARYLNLAMPPRSAHRTVETIAKEEKPAKPSPPPMPSSRRHPSISASPASRTSSPVPILAPAPIVAAAAPRIATAGPPPIPKWTRPDQRPPASSSAHDELFTMSHPSPTTHGSSALDLAHYFAPWTTWDSAWYAELNPLPPPPLKGNGELRYAGATQQYESTKTVYSGVLFADLSMCWWSVSFPAGRASDPNDAQSVQRFAEYLPRPRALDRAALLEAHSTYGETVAAFAESFEGTGQYCARGECWDLAHEALEYVSQFDYVPKPVPSTSRTHGHLIFCGKATGKGRPQYGRWRGGDDRVRRGDIVEWRRVSLSMSSGQYAYTQWLGDPDHTAVIVSDAVPRVAVTDGQSVLPADLGTLEVVEQSVGTGKTPHRSTYVLSGLEEGEMWIYRPVSMEAYVGCLLDSKRPDGVNALVL